MQVSQAKKLKDPERENARLKKLIAEQTLDKAILEEALTRAIVDLASEYGRYGYRRITALLRDQGWHVNHKRIERIWRREGLNVPRKQPKRGRLWLNDGCCVRRRPQYQPTCGPMTSSSIEPKMADLSASLR